MVLPPIDPNLQSVIDRDFKQVDLKLGENASQALCSPHTREQCTDCGVDFTAVNNLAKLFVSNPQLACPPPPQVVQQQRSAAVTKTKEDGNVNLVLLQRMNHWLSISLFIGFI